MTRITKRNPLETALEQGLGKCPLTVEQALWMVGEYSRLLEAISRKIEGPFTSTETVWAGQSALAKRYHMSVANMGRYLVEARELNAVRILRPERGGKKGNVRYHVEDMDAFMAGQGRKRENEA